MLTAAPFVLAALVVNLYPWDADSDTEVLVALTLPVVLWFAVAYPYMGGTIRSHERRMDFVRFTGEWFIYYVLIALGGGVLMALTAGILEPAGVDVDRIAEWVLPSGAAGAVIVAAWLVESKQRVVENMAPVLTMLFTPLFAVMLACAAVVYAVTGLGGAFDRELLSVFDALLVVVLALVLYGMSARDAVHVAGWMDGIQLVAVVSALVLDLMVLGAMIARIGDLGFTPNRTAALGLNLVLLVNLAGAAWLSARFLTRRSRLHRLERWQTTYLPVFALWAAAVVVILPPLFGFTDRVGAAQPSPSQYSAVPSGGACSKTQAQTPILSLSGYSEIPNSFCVETIATRTGSWPAVAHLVRPVWAGREADDIAGVEHTLALRTPKRRSALRSRSATPRRSSSKWYGLNVWPAGRRRRSCRAVRHRASTRPGPPDTRSRAAPPRRAQVGLALVEVEDLDHKTLAIAFSIRMIGTERQAPPVSSSSRSATGTRRRCRAARRRAWTSARAA